MEQQKFDAAHQGVEPAKSDSLEGSTDGGGRQKHASIVVFDSSPLSLLALAGVLDSQGYRCTCARNPEAAVAALAMGTRQDLLVCDVGDDATQALETLEAMRQARDGEPLPAVLIAESRWAGLEQKVDSMPTPTRCLFKPIDANALIAVVDQILWMPNLVDVHRRKGTRPSRPGWITL
ncbi:MAG: response regulator [Rubripirellula sp.]